MESEESTSFLKVTISLRVLHDKDQDPREIAKMFAYTYFPNHIKGASNRFGHMEIFYEKTEVSRPLDFDQRLLEIEHEKRSKYGPEPKCTDLDST